MSKQKHQAEQVARDTQFSVWLRKSNAAAKYREAFELIDRMAPELRVDLILLLTRKASAEHHEAFHG